MKNISTQTQLLLGEERNFDILVVAQQFVCYSVLADVDDGQLGVWRLVDQFSLSHICSIREKYSVNLLVSLTQ